jgi:antitoxin MazE
VRKKLSAVGNSLGVVIEKPILELLNIDRETELDISTDGDRLIIEPVRGERKRRFNQSIDKVMKRHDKTFRKLAK